MMGDNIVIELLNSQYDITYKIVINGNKVGIYSSSLFIRVKF